MFPMQKKNYESDDFSEKTLLNTVSKEIKMKELLYKMFS